MAINRGFKFRMAKLRPLEVQQFEQAERLPEVGNRHTAIS
jgi:hypothetical protein